MPTAATLNAIAPICQSGLSREMGYKWRTKLPAQRPGGIREGDVLTIINNTKMSFPSSGERNFKRYNYGARFTANYQVNKYNCFSAGFYIGKKYQSRVADLLYSQRQNLSGGTVQQFTYFNSTDQQKKGSFALASLNYVHEFGKGAKLTLSGLYEGAVLSGTTYNRNLVYPGMADNLQYTVNPYTNPPTCMAF